MAYYAQLEQDTVTQVIVVNDEIVNGAKFAHDLLGGLWVETFIDNPQKNFACIGYTYDLATKNFIAPQPYPSWTLNKSCVWQAPKPKPEGNYYWDETLKDWVNYDF